MKGYPKPRYVDVPDGCVPCSLCGEHCMQAEGVEDWKGLGFVVRIFSMCPESLEEYNDDIRTEFLPADEAVEMWNDMQEMDVCKE